MNKGKIISILVIIVIALIVVNSAFYRLNEYEQVIITQFGEPIGEAVKKPGLRVKMPLIHKVHRFDKRILTWDGAANQIPTADKRYIELDATARWKIVDPLKFYQSVGTEVGIQTRLDDVIDSASRDIVSSHNLIEVVRNSNMIFERPVEEEDATVEKLEKISKGREELRLMILERASELVPQYGIELVDVQIKRLNYIDRVRKKVYERMISERQKIAAKYRSEGQGEKAKITGMMNREIKKITSEAYRKAQEIKGEADGQATRIYAQSYNKDPEFYSFLKTMEIYGKTLTGNSKAILTTESEIYKYLKSNRPR
ncbi:MAG: protease modulator HflC [Candidatus Latescibacteria bacterium]|nr:protease modulator HflC [bacterium]MBD3424927.1 protease modulator HflC [Candidatus Latescibacterota bacterium]